MPEEIKKTISKGEARAIGVERLAQDQQLRRFFPELNEILDKEKAASKEQSPAPAQ